MEKTKNCLQPLHFVPQISFLHDENYQYQRRRRRHSFNGHFPGVVPVAQRLQRQSTEEENVLKRLVLTRLRPHLLGSANFSQFQSAYREGQKTFR